MRARGGCSTRQRASSGIEEAEESLAELSELAVSAGAEVVDALMQVRDKPDAATLIGRGKIDELRIAANEFDADFVLFDHELTATQLRNLEKQLDLRVLDRTQLILDIFAGHARTREGSLQVELAQLQYLAPRLTGRGVEMSRLAGGIGARGPVRRNSRRTAAASEGESLNSKHNSNPCVLIAAGSVRNAVLCRCRPSPWSVTPMRASRRCSTR